MADLPSLDSADLVSMATYAKMRGCARQTVADRVAAGQIDAFGPDKLICPRLAETQWAANVRARAPRATGSSVAGGRAAGGIGRGGGATAPSLGNGDEAESYPAAMARQARTNADRSELALAFERGSAIDRETTAAAFHAGFRSLRDRVMAAPRRCARDVVNVADVRSIEIRMEEELRRALSFLDADYMASPPEIAKVVVERRIDGAV